MATSDTTRLSDSQGGFTLLEAVVALGIIAGLLHWPIDERPVVRTAAA